MKTTKNEIISRLGMSYFQDNGSGFATVSQLNQMFEYFVSMIPDINTIQSGDNVYLEYGINVIKPTLTKSLNCYFPEKPVKGQNVVVVNMSPYVVMLRSKEVGASINGAENAIVQIPADGKPYTFTCWENPLPGAWTWTPPATNQYDSGDFVFTAPGGDWIVSPVSTGNVVVSDSYSISNGLAIDSLNNPVIRQQNGGGNTRSLNFKPAPHWNQITKIKIYTNLKTTNIGDISFRLAASHAYNFYEQGTTVYKGANGNSSSFIQSDIAFDSYAGGSAPAPGPASLTSNVGDPTTCYIEKALVFPIGLLNSFGDTFIGTETFGGVLCDKYFSRYISLQMQWRDISLPNCKARFFIEYN